LNRQRTRSTSIFGAIGVLSNVAGAVGLLYSRLEIAVVVIAVIALASGAYLIIRRYCRSYLIAEDSFLHLLGAADESPLHHLTIPLRRTVLSHPRIS